MPGVPRFYYELAVHPDTQDATLLEEAYKTLPEMPDFNPPLDLDIYVAAHQLQYPNQIVVPILIDENGFELAHKPELDPRLAHLNFDYESWEIVVHEIEYRFASVKPPKTCAKSCSGCLKTGACLISACPFTWGSWTGYDGAAQKQNKVSRRCLTWCLDDSVERFREFTSVAPPASLVSLFPGAKSVEFKGFRSSHQPPMRALLRAGEGKNLADRIGLHPVKPFAGRTFVSHFRFYTLLVIEFEALPPPIPPKEWRDMWTSYYVQKRAEQQIQLIEHHRSSRRMVPQQLGASTEKLVVPVETNVDEVSLPLALPSVPMLQNVPVEAQVTPSSKHLSLSSASHLRPLLGRVVVTVPTRGMVPAPGPEEEMVRFAGPLNVIPEDNLGSSPENDHPDQHHFAKPQPPPRRSSRSEAKQDMYCTCCIGCWFCCDMCDDCCDYD